VTLLTQETVILVDTVETSFNIVTKDDSASTIVYSGSQGLPGVTLVEHSEVPVGLINDTNVTFILSRIPSFISGVLLLLNGVTQYNGVDYIVSGNVVTFIEPPIAGSSIFVYYSSGGAHSGTSVAVYTPIIDNSGVNGLVTITWSNGSIQVINTEKNTIITLPAPVKGISGTLVIAYGGVHTITIAGGGLLFWENGVPVVFTSIGGVFDELVCRSHNITHTKLSAELNFSTLEEAVTAWDGGATTWDGGATTWD